MELSPILTVWLALALCTALITLAGTQLLRYGDMIAGKLPLYLLGK